ncbi:MAG: SIS domain-containing protein [Candidatus Caldatribacteriota bacterium]|nr:SIS domain-containing protein [Candidatus Caldatribacteriota bacterium]
MTKKGSNIKKNDFVYNALDEHIEIFNEIKKDKILQSRILEVARKLVSIYSNKGKLLLCGNGGSAAQAQHLATELVSRFYFDRKALNAEALSVNTSSITAIANDYSFKKIFSRQIEAKGESGDMLISLTTSGKSKNIIEALKTSHNHKIYTVLLTGQISESNLLNYTDIIISVPSKIIPRIQEAHIFIGHLICEYVERELFAKK